MYQFIHIETYARKASTKVKPTKGTPKSSPKPKSDVGEIIGETMRDEGFCNHVANLQPPKFLYGDEAKLRSMPARIELNIEAYQKKHGGKKLRSDAHVLLAGVMSFPRELEQSDPARYKAWKQCNLIYLHMQFGAKLQCVIEHQDEEHPHLHFYVLSDDEPNAKMLHKGYIAASEHPPLSKESKEAYKGAMRDFQSDYYDRVGYQSGLLRDGPKRVRMPTGEYKALKRSTNERYEQDQRLKHSQELKANEIRQAGESNRAFLQEQKADLTKQRAELKEGFANLDKLQQNVAKKMAELDAILKDAKLVQSMQTLSGLGLLDVDPGTYVPGQPAPS